MTKPLAPAAERAFLALRGTSTQYLRSKRTAPTMDRATRPMLFKDRPTLEGLHPGDRVRVLKCACRPYQHPGRVGVLVAEYIPQMARAQVVLDDLRQRRRDWTGDPEDAEQGARSHYMIPTTCRVDAVERL